MAGFFTALGTAVGSYFGVPAVGGAVGGAVDSAFDRSDRKDQQAENVALQREFAQHGVGWRVADAKAAGVHPLYAIGASGAAFSPNPVVPSQTSDFGPSVERARSASMTVEQRNLHVAQLGQLAASVEKDFAMASYYDALAMKARGNDAGSSSFPSGVYSSTGVPSVESSPLFSDAVKPEADPLVSRSSRHQAQTAGRDHPSLREFRTESGDRVLLPAGSGGGVPEEIDSSMLPGIVGANIRRYGWSAVPAWFARALGLSYDQVLDAAVDFTHGRPVYEGGRVHRRGRDIRNVPQP